MNCITHNETIDLILNSFKADLKNGFEPYRNHVYRVYNIAIHGLTNQKDIQTITITAAFHDLGIWTHKTFDYIQPSVDLAKQYCLKNFIDSEAIEEIEMIIREHHKLFPIKNYRLAEVFRKADLVDLSLGVIRKQMDKKHIHQLKLTFPNKGFHMYLFRLFFKNLFQHPLRPLPMYKF